MAICSPSSPFQWPSPYFWPMGGGAAARSAHAWIRQWKVPLRHAIQLAADIDCMRDYFNVAYILYIIIQKWSRKHHLVKSRNRCFDFCVFLFSLFCTSTSRIDANHTIISKQISDKHDASSQGERAPALLTGMCKGWDDTVVGGRWL